MTSVGVAAGVGAPSAVVLGVARDAQRTVRVLPVRTEYVALVQRHRYGVHMVIPIPHHADAGVILSSICFVRVLETLNSHFR